MEKLFFLVVFFWIGWLLFHGLLTGSIWVKGGASDRFTRSLDMNSFAHKVSRKENPNTYWFNVLFYTCINLLLLYILIQQ